MTVTTRRNQRQREGGCHPAAAERIESACFAAALAIALVAVPLAMGGRHPLGQALLTAAAIAAVVAWTLQSWREGDGTWQFGVVDALVIAGLAIGFLQVVPLPEGWIRAISPNLYPLLPCLDGSPGSLSRWERLSLTPGETLACLGILLAQGGFVAVLAQRIRSVQDVERVLVVVVCSTALLAVLGVVQYLAGNGRYLWFYDFAYNDAGGAVKGTFTNRNHFASFLAAGCGAVIWWVLARPIAAGPPPAGGATPSGFVPGRQAVGWLLVAAVGFAALSSLSRGGSLALAVAVTVSFAILFRSRAWRLSASIGFASAIALMAVALVIHGWERLASRFSMLFDGPLQAGAAGRIDVWRAACGAMSDFPWLGTGVGSHADVSPLYMPPMGEIVFTHAENSYLNVGVETGFVGLAIAVAAVLAGLAACAAVALRGNDRERSAAAALAAGVAAGAVHGLVDFVWYVPACSTLLMVLGACAVALARGQVAWLPVVHLRFGRTGALIAGAGCIALLCGSGVRQFKAARAESAWEQSIKESQALSAAVGAANASRPAAGKVAVVEAGPPAGTPTADSAAGESVVATYADGSSAQSDTELRELRDILDRRIAELVQTVAQRPDHPRAWAELALARMDHFGLSRRLAGRSTGVMDLRLAADRSRFATPAELRAWVRRAAGSDYANLELAFQDALQAVRIAPLSGDAWCVLGNLAFLQTRPELSTACVAQAMRVRPASSLVLFEAANQALIDGDPERADALWRESFAADTRQRGRIIALLLPRISSAEACRLLEPDLDGLRAIDAAWARRESQTELIDLRTLRLQAVLERSNASEPSAKCRLLIEAAGLHRGLGQAAEARANLEAAIGAEPASYQAHRALADAALAAEDWKTAQRELEWCLLRRSDSQDLKRTMEKLRSLQIEGKTGGHVGQLPVTGKLKKL